MSSDPSFDRSNRSPETTAVLLERIRSGDARAREQLFARYLPLIRRVAHGRVPECVRGQIDTDDLVQSAFQRALSHIDRFEPRREGAFLAYLRRIVLNQIRDAARRAHHRPPAGALPNDVPCTHATTLQQAIGREALEAYEAELMQLAPRRRRAVILRLEFHLSFTEIAEALDLPSATAARLVVGRAIDHLAKRIRARGITS